MYVMWCVAGVRCDGEGQQQTEAGGAAGPATEHRVLRRGAPGMVQGLPEGLPLRTPHRRGVQEDLWQLLSLRGCLKVC